MKLTTKGRYSTRLMIDLAIYGTQHPVLLKDVAHRQNISEKYLGNLVPLLKSAGLIQTTRGVHGGVCLAVPAGQITLKDIIAAVEGPICLVGCINDASFCKLNHACAVKDFWGDATNQIINVLRSFTLEEMVQRQKEKTEIGTYSI